jgi:valyl-tRNA synthetase
MNVSCASLSEEETQDFQKEELDLPDRWILSRFYSNLSQLNKALNNYRFSDAANILYQFFWHEFCDWYLELAKFKIKEKNTQLILYKVLKDTLKCLHPFMPFITEEIWQRLNQTTSIMLGPWPNIQKKMIDKDIEKRMQILIDSIVAIRNLRSQLKIEPQKKIQVIISVKDSKIEDLFKDNISYITGLARLEKLEVYRNLKRPESSVSKVLTHSNIYILYKGIIDVSGERERISKEKEQVSLKLNQSLSRIKDKGFLKNAPRELIEKEKEKIKNLKGMLLELKRLQEELNEG